MLEPWLGPDKPISINTLHCCGRTAKILSAKRSLSRPYSCKHEPNLFYWVDDGIRTPTRLKTISARVYSRSRSGEPYFSPIAPINSIPSPASIIKTGRARRSEAARLHQRPRRAQPGNHFIVSETGQQLRRWRPKKQASTGTAPQYTRSQRLQLLKLHSCGDPVVRCPLNVAIPPPRLSLPRRKSKRIPQVP